MRRRSQQIALLLTVVLSGASGFLPLFAGLGYESALFAGLVLPALASSATALDVGQQQTTPLDAFERGVLSGLFVALAGFAMAILHGFRVGFCSVLGGAALFALGPGLGAVMGGVWGAVAGLVVARCEPRRFRRATTLGLALLGPAAGVLLSLWRFYSSPMVFAFDPFFGYFAGPLYDTVIDAVPGLVSYRLGSALTLTALFMLLSHCSWQHGRLQLTRPTRVSSVVLGSLAGVGSLAISVFGADLGHFSTCASIRAALGRGLSSERCELIYSGAILERDARALARECDAHVRQIEAYFAARGPERTVVYLFSSSEEKGRLTGAASTQIAKPWRSEIYIQASPYPHPVLGHELAHVIAGSFGGGPFRVAGPLGGLLPDPGRIEGVAVAASPSEVSDLNLQGWARAMLELDLLPPLERVFRLSFLGENSSKAYSVAGAFVAWFKERYGAHALRAWYGGESLPSLTGGKALAVLEREWRGSLASVQIEAEALESARARFDRPSIFGRRCPHVVDELEQEAAAKLDFNDHDGARESFERLLGLDPSHVRARIALGTCAVRQARFDEARRRYAEVAHDTSLPRLVRASAEEALADLELVLERPEQANQHYARIAHFLLDEDHVRTLEIKRLAGAPLARNAIANLLIGGVRFGPSWDVAGVKLGEWSASLPTDGVADYLIGKNLYLRGRWQEAATHLDRALGREISTPYARREALRVRTVLACAMNDHELARQTEQRWRAEPGIALARLEGMARFMRRCVPDAH